MQETDVTVRFGVIGTGNIGAQHVELLSAGEIKGASLAATASRSGEAKQATHYNDYLSMLDEAELDAVLIATPTMSHVEIAEAVLNRGLHVLMEKPVAMSVGQAEDLISKVKLQQKFAVMLNQRFHPLYRRLKSLLTAGAIGELQRVNWTMTAWYRPDIYYRVSNWRGTWPGEGGGLLINQCIHNIDILQWLTGLPETIYAEIGFGRYHDIDVEDEVTALMTFPGGATCVLTASSGEAPGINRLELVGDRGTIVCERDELEIQTASISVSEHLRTTDEMFGMPVFTRETISDFQSVNQHAAVINNFVRSIEGEEKLATPGEEGLGSLQLANGMLLSAWTGEKISLPLDRKRFESMLAEKIATSSLREPEDIEARIDMDASYR